MRRNAWSGSANWETNIEQLCKVSTPWNDDHQFKKEELETVGDLTTGCHQAVLKVPVIWHASADHIFCGL